MSPEPSRPDRGPSPGPIRAASPGSDPAPEVAPSGPARATTRLADLVGVLGVGVTTLVLLLREARPLTDPDVVWHVLLGRALSRTWDFGSTDPLSDLTTVPWVYHQWLPEVAAAAAYDRAGWWGVALLAHAGRVAIVLALWAVCRREAPALPAAIATAVALVGASMSLGPRPQLFGLALLAVTVGAWRATARDLRPRWWLVPLTWVWACSHGTWTLGVLLGLLFAAGVAWDHRDRLTRRAVASLLAVPVAAGIAGCLTPVGPRLLTASSHIAAIADLISEWQRPTPTDLAVAVTAVALLGVAIALGAARRALRADEVALILSALVALVVYQRTVAVAAILLSPLVAQLLGRATGRGPASAAATDAGSRRRQSVAVAVIAGLGLGAGLLVLPPTADRPGGVPAGLLPRLAGLPAHSVVVADERLGGWLMAAVPGLRPWIDTRAEAFGRPVVTAFLATLRAEPGWSQRLDDLDAAAVLVGTGAPLVGALAADPAWAPAGSDADFVLFVRR